MQIGEAVTVVVVSFAAARRSIDCALPDMAGHPQATVPTVEAAAARSPRRGRAKMETLVAEAVIEQLGSPQVDADTKAQTPAKRGTTRKRAASPAAATVAAEEPAAIRRGGDDGHDDADDAEQRDDGPRSEAGVDQDGGEEGGGEEDAGEEGTGEEGAGEAGVGPEGAGAGRPARRAHRTLRATMPR